MPAIADPRDRLALGNQSLEISPLCVGMVDDPATITTAFDSGINTFFVSADLHWPRYRATRVGLESLLARSPSVRNELVVAAVSYVAQPDFSWAPYRELLEDIEGLERIDVLVMGGIYSDTYRARLERLKHMFDDGRFGARAIAATFHDRQCARDAIVAGDLDLALLRFNPRHPGATVDVFPELAQASQTSRTRVYTFKSTVGFTPSTKLDALGLDADVTRPTITDYYRFALGHPSVNGLLCSPTKPAHVSALVDALAKGPLEGDYADHMIALADFVRRSERDER